MNSGEETGTHKNTEGPKIAGNTTQNEGSWKSRKHMSMQEHIKRDNAGQWDRHRQRD